MMVHIWYKELFAGLPEQSSPNWCLKHVHFPSVLHVPCPLLVHRSQAPVCKGKVLNLSRVFFSQSIIFLTVPDFWTVDC